MKLLVAIFGLVALCAVAQPTVSGPVSGAFNIKTATFGGYFEWWTADSLGLANGASLTTWTGANGYVSAAEAANLGGKATNNFQNGHAAVLFGIPSGSEQISTSPASVTAPWILFVVAKQQSNGANMAIAGGTNSPADYMVIGSGSTYLAYAGSLQTGGNNAVSLNNLIVYTLICSNNASSALLTNGVVAVQGDIGNSPLQGVGMGAVNNNNQFPFSGWITDVVLYTNGLTWSQIQNNVTFFKNRLAIP